MKEIKFFFLCLTTRDVFAKVFRLSELAFAWIIIQFRHVLVNSISCVTVKDQFDDVRLSLKREASIFTLVDNLLT